MYHFLERYSLHSLRAPGQHHLFSSQHARDFIALARDCITGKQGHLLQRCFRFIISILRVSFATLREEGFCNNPSYASSRKILAFTSTRISHQTFYISSSLLSKCQKVYSLSVALTRLVIPPSLFILILCREKCNSVVEVNANKLPLMYCSLSIRWSVHFLLKSHI